MSYLCELEKTGFFNTNAPHLSKLSERESEWCVGAKTFSNLYMAQYKSDIFFRWFCSNTFEAIATKRRQFPFRISSSSLGFS